MSVRVKRFAAPAVVLVLLAAMPSVARAHSSASVLPALGAAKELSGGLYEVTLRTGGSLTTHGADGPQDLAPLGIGALRPPLCTRAPHQRVLYGRPLGAPDRSGSIRPIVEAAMYGMNAELDRAALESGGRHADYRVACDGSGSIAIGTFVNLRTSSFGDVVDAARLGGALDPDVDYTIFYDDPTPGACGVGSFSADDRPGADNANNSGGGYAVVYSDCWTAATVMHENGHNQGAVQPGAPNAMGTQGHCRDESDVMCYADSPELATVLTCPGGEMFDCGYDDYFDVEPEPGEWLQSHWNVGSAANRFIALSDVVPGEEAPARACHSDLPAPLAVDTAACTEPPAEPEPDPADDEAAEDPPPVRIVQVRYHVRLGRVQVRLSCPALRTTTCRGRVSVVRASSPARSFRIAPDETAVVRVPLSRRTRRAWRAGPRRHVRVIAEEAGASARVSKSVLVGARR